MGPSTHMQIHFFCIKVDTFLQNVSCTQDTWLLSVPPLITMPTHSGLPSYTMVISFSPNMPTRYYYCFVRISQVNQFLSGHFSHYENCVPLNPFSLLEYRRKITQFHFHELKKEFGPYLVAIY